MYERIRQNPKFTELVERRGRFAWLLSGIVLVVFYGFVMAVAFAPDLVSMRPIDGSNLTVGILAGLFQFIVFWVLALIYVRRANTEFDDLNKEIVADAWGDE
ncbi:MAG: DUF485 domain-containing protein [Gammaproteobacteria bacterium]|nr:DUF485 domain-containing protein [Gammaproteobacteria bacterium]